MPAFHCTLFFSYGKDYGWVEQFWRQEPNLNAALAMTLKLAFARFNILGAGATVYRVRVSQAGMPHASLSASVDGTTLANPAMIPIEGVDVRLQSEGSPAHWRNFCLRGIPLDGIEQVGRRWRWSPLLAAKAPAWLNRLATDGWLLRIEEALGPPQPILGMNLIAWQDNDIFGESLNPEDPPDGTTAVVAFTGDHLPQGGTLVKVHACRPSPNTPRNRKVINGTHPIFYTYGNTVSWFGDFGSADSSTGGTVQVCQISYRQIASASLVRRVGKKCGPYKEGVSTGPVPVAAVQIPAGPLVFPKPVLISGPPEPPATNTYITLHDIAAEIWKGYTEPLSQKDPLIGIARLVGVGSVEYAVFLGGVDRSIEYPLWEQYWEAANAFIGAPDAYTDSVRETIRQNTEDGCALHVFGHSFGGMVAQWLASAGPGLGSRYVKTVIGLGTAWVVNSSSFNSVQNYHLFAVRGDPIIWLSQGGWLVPIRVWTARYDSAGLELSLFLLNQLWPVGQILLDGDGVSLDPLARHNCYNTLPACFDVWWNGGAKSLMPPLAKQPLITGPVKRFLYPPG